MTLERKFNKWIHVNYLINGVLYLDKKDTISFIDIVNEFIQKYNLTEDKYKLLIKYCNNHYKIKQ